MFYDIDTFKSEFKKIFCIKTEIYVNAMRSHFFLHI